MTEPAWLREARKYLGLRELSGARHEKEILKFFTDAGHPEIRNDETAWCAAFINAVLKRTGYKGTQRLDARSFQNFGQKLSEPRIGCIVVFKRGNSSWQGHVAFYLGETPTHIRVLGGNQNNSVSIANYPKKDLLAYRWPKPKEAASNKPLAQSRTVIGAAVAGTGTAAGAVVDAVQETAYQVDSAQSYFSAGNILGLVIGAIVLAGAGYAIWARWDDAGRPLPWAR